MFQNKVVLFAAGYRQPGTNREKVNAFLSDFQSSLDKAIDCHPETLIILGDFNDRCTKWVSDHKVVGSELNNDFVDLLHLNNLFQLIDEPTRYGTNTNTVLDLLITDSPGYIINSGVSPPLLHNLDHCTIYGTLHFVRNNDVAYHRQVWVYDNADFVGLNEAIDQTPWDVLLDLGEGLDDAVQILTDQLFN